MIRARRIPPEQGAHSIRASAREAPGVLAAMRRKNAYIVLVQLARRGLTSAPAVFEWQEPGTLARYAAWLFSHGQEAVLMPPCHPSFRCGWGSCLPAARPSSHRRALCLSVLAQTA